MDGCRRSDFGVRISGSAGLATLGLVLGAGARDWPQLAHDAARTAHTERGVAPPYRARWIWGTQPPLWGREAVVIAGDQLLFAEEYAVTCVEHREP